MNKTIISLSFLLLSSTAIFTMQETTKRKFEEIFDNLKKSAGTSSPTKLTLTSTAQEICLEDKINPDKACISQKELFALLISTFGMSSDVEAIINKIKNEGIPLYQATLNTNRVDKKLKIDLTNPNKSHTFSMDIEKETANTTPIFINGKIKDIIEFSALVKITIPK